jgi:hypothetical protein
MADWNYGAVMPKPSNLLQKLFRQAIPMTAASKLCLNAPNQKIRITSSNFSMTHKKRLVIRYATMS